MLLSGQLHPGDTVTVDVQGDKLNLATSAAPERPAEPPAGQATDTDMNAARLYPGVVCCWQPLGRCDRSVFVTTASAFVEADPGAPAFERGE
jgi:hypothetical protein